MRRTVSLLIAMIVCFSAAFAQKIEQKKPELDDFISILKLKGVEVFPFDISGLSDRKCNISFSVREYENGKMVKDNIMSRKPSYKNMGMLSDLSEKSRKEIQPEEMDDAERGIYHLAKKLTVGFAPMNDSIKVVQFAVDRAGSATWWLKLKSITDGKSGVRLFNYHVRPFVMGPKVEYDTFTPLVLVGSAWYDAKHNLFRFCGENEIKPDLSSEIVSNIPHFYVIGINVIPVDDKNKQDKQN